MISATEVLGWSQMLQPRPLRSSRSTRRVFRCQYRPPEMWCQSGIAHPYASLPSLWMWWHLTHTHLACFGLPRLVLSVGQIYSEVQRALQMLHEVDSVLEQLAVFWANSEVSACDCSKPHQTQHLVFFFRVEAALECSCSQLPYSSFSRFSHHNEPVFYC